MRCVRAPDPGTRLGTHEIVAPLGVLLYELTTGRRPFAGRTLADISSTILRDALEPLSRVRAGLPAELERIVSRCLEKSPRERPQSALDVANDLRRLRQQLERVGRPRGPGPGRVASIAVLPFVNRSRDEADEYFSDGLADELLNVLSRIRWLRVVARASAFQFKGKNEDLAVIGARLSVATVLDGSVRMAGNRVRISVQLVKVADSSHLWSETYDRTADDIFAVQDDIAQSLVKELRFTFLGEDADAMASDRVRAEVASAAKGRGADPEAHRLHLLARHLLDRDRREEGTRVSALRLQLGGANPMSGEARFRLSLPQASRVRATGYDAMGRAVRSLGRDLDSGKTRRRLGDGSETVYARGQRKHILVRSSRRWGGPRCTGRSAAVRLAKGRVGRRGDSMRSTRTRTLAFMTALLLVGCRQSPTVPLYDGYTLHGIVLDARSGGLLSDVQVLVGREGAPDMRAYVLTDDAGRFEFKPSPNTAPSTELFRCEKAGYVPREVLARSSTRLREFEYRLEIRLEPAAAL